MIKKIVGLLVTTTLLVSLAACGSSNQKESTSQDTKSAELNIDNQEQFKDLKGYWIKDFTHEDFVNKSNNVMKDIENKTKDFGLDYKKEDQVKEISGVTASVKSIYLDNKNPETNKLESMQFESQLMGEAQDSGRIQLKLSLKIDGNAIKKDNKFNLGDTSLAEYSQIMTGAKDRNFNDINKKIVDIIKSDKNEGIIDDDINGLSEEFAVSEDYIVYTLSTKIYKFTDNTNEGIK